MPATTEWLEKDRIVITKLFGDLTLDEITLANEKHLEMVANGERNIHVILDVSELSKFPTEIRSIKASGDAYLEHPNMGFVMVVGIKNPILRFLSSIVTQLSSADMRQVATIEEAIARINQIDGIHNSKTE